MGEKQDVSQKLASSLRASGPTSPASLMEELSISQPTLFRAAKKNAQSVVALGGRRNRKLAATRTIGKLGTSSLPVFMVSPEGDIRAVGKILALHPSTFTFVLDAAPTMPRYYTGLPSFIRDVRPGGFIGTVSARKHTDLKLPTDITRWGNDQYLEFMSRRGEDLYGNVLLGAESLERYQRLTEKLPEVIDTENPGPKYLALAEATLGGKPQGTCIKGAQPKFSALISDGRRDAKWVLVKFSPMGESAGARRWRDLLRCEALSLEVLREYGISTADTRIIEAGGRVFLESVRFDRVGWKGRKRVLSMAALEASWSEKKQHWGILGGMLEREKKIYSEDYRTILKLESFARMIANSDRGADNISFTWLQGDERAILAPVYDMLPMFYAPDDTGDLPSAAFSKPLYDPSLLGVWNEARTMAAAFWKRVSEDKKISEDFRAIAAKNLKLLD